MGQKTNLLTLRSEVQDTRYSRLNFEEFLYSYFFFNFLNFLFQNNKIFLTNHYFFFFENKIFLTCFLFYRSAKLIKYNKLKRISFSNSFSFKLNYIFKLFRKFKNNLLIFTFINLNVMFKKLNQKRFISFFFNSLKNSGLILFPRRFNFFLDFIQLSILFLDNKINIKFLVNIISEIFRILQKKKHSKFFIFITKYLNLLVSNPFKKHYDHSSNLLGIKFVINGKLKGKPRSTSYTYTAGKVPIQLLNSNIDYAKSHAFTIYGVFGIKLWAYRI